MELIMGKMLEVMRCLWYGAQLFNLYGGVVYRLVVMTCHKAAIRTLSVPGHLRAWCPSPSSIFLRSTLNH